MNDKMKQHPVMSFQAQSQNPNCPVLSQCLVYNREASVHTFLSLYPHNGHSISRKRRVCCEANKQ